MENKNSLQKNVQKIQLISIYVLIIGIFTQGMYALPIETTWLINIPCVLLIGCSLIDKNKSFSINKYNILYFIFVAYLIIGEMFENRRNIIYIIYFFSGIIVMNTIRVFTTEYRSKIVTFFKWLCIIAACLTFFSIVAKDFYFSNLLPMVHTEKYIEYIYNFYKTGAYSGIFIQIGINAFYMGIGIIIIINQIINNMINEKKVKIRNYIFLIMFIGALLLTKKRGMLLYSAFTAMFIMLFAFLKIGKKGLVKILSFTIPIVLLVSVLLVTNENLLAVFERFQKEEDFFSGREDLYSYAMQMFEEKPIFGNGLRSFREEYSEINNSEEKLDVHNVFLQLLTEEGIVGTIIYLSELFFILIVTIKKLSSSIKKRKDITLISVSTSVQIIFILYFMSGNTLYDTFTLFTYFIFAMLGFYKEELNEENRNFNVS